MSVSIKSPEELDIIREGGARLGAIVDVLVSELRAGMSTMDIDTRARQLIAQVGGQSAFLGYRPHGVKTPFPAAVCVSINEEVVHGIPSKDVVLQNGDVVTVDCGLKYKGFYTDHARTSIIGEGTKITENLVRICDEALQIGIDACVAGATNLEPGKQIEKFIAGRYGIVRELAGHGVGYAVHEDPYIPNFASKGKGVFLQPGMVIAVEPMLTIGGPDVWFLDDEYTVVTRSGAPAAHSEHTVIITAVGPEIVTLAGRYTI